MSEVPQEHSKWYSSFPAIEMRYEASLGRYLVAAQDISKGDLVLIDYPYAWVIYEPWKQQICRFCFGTIERDPPRSCQKCKQVFYCSLDCQKNDCVEHFADECQILQQLYANGPISIPEELISEFKLTLRVLARKLIEQTTNNDFSKMKSWDRNKTFSEYATLISNPKEFPEELLTLFRYWISNYIVNMKEYFKKLRNNSPLTDNSTTEDEILEILCRNRRNSFAYGNGMFEEPQGCAVCISASFFNHSCSPNIMLRTLPSHPMIDDVITGNPNRSNELGPLLGFVAAKDIVIGEKLCISYLDNGMLEPGLLSDDEDSDDEDVNTTPFPDVIQRRLDLKQNYLFECQCERCVTESQQVIEDINTPETTNEPLECKESNKEPQHSIGENVTEKIQNVIENNNNKCNEEPENLLSERFQKLLDGKIRTCITPSGIPVSFVIQGFTAQRKSNKVFQSALVQIEGKDSPDQMPLSKLLFILASEI